MKSDFQSMRLKGGHLRIFRRGYTVLLISWFMPSVLLSLVAVSEIVPAQDPRYGVVRFDDMGGQMIQKIQELGAGTARVGCYWWQLEPARDFYDWSCADNIINNAPSWLTLYFGLQGTPAWANGGRSANYPPADMQDWRNYVFNAISRYRGRNIVWEIWNEPNLDQFLIDDGSGSVYKQLFDWATSARDAAGPGEILAGPETSHHAVRSGYFQSVITFMTPRMAPQDVVSVHLYLDGPFLTNYMSAIGPFLAGHQLSLTETGRDSRDLEAQRGWYAYILGFFDGGSYPWWTRVIFYRLHSGSDCCDESITYGGWSNKPAFNFYRDWIQNHQGTNLAAFVSQSVPPTMTAGQPYNVSVTMTNNGTSTWRSASGYPRNHKLGAQNPQDNTTWGFNRVEMPSGTAVPPGGSFTFNFTVTAPSVDGTYNFQWRMLQEAVEWFGDYTPNIVVNVTGGGGATYTVNARCSNGQYVVAEGGGGGIVNCNRDVAGPWETFIMTDLTGGQLISGHAVSLRTDNGRYLQAVFGGGDRLTAEPSAVGPWETFFIEKAGGGLIVNGDLVDFRTWDGHYVVAEGGGGGIMNANRIAVGPWETFTIVIR